MLTPTTEINTIEMNTYNKRTKINKKGVKNIKEKLKYVGEISY